MRDSRRALGARALFVVASCSVACAGLAACSASSTRSTAGAGTGASTTTGSGPGTGAGTGTGGGGAHDDCATLCATEAAACPKTVVTACVDACESSKAEVSWCTAPATAVTDCLAGQPATSFQCDMNGVPSAKSGICAPELAAAVSCWDDGPEAGLPDLSAACSMACANEASLSCADPNCTSDCAGATSPSAKCHGAFAAVVACAAKQAPADFVCSTATPPGPGLKPGYCAFENVLLYTCLGG